MPRHLGCALLLSFGSAWLLTQTTHGQGRAVTILEALCDHPVTASLRPQQLKNCCLIWCLKTGQEASRQGREFSFLSAGSPWAWENSGEITRVDWCAFRVESRAPTQRLQLL
jgi:pullulanase/glycogen debranching enzyme